MGNQSETKPLRERVWDVSVEVIGPIIYSALGWMMANALTSIKWGIITVLAVAFLSIIAFYFLNRSLPKKGIVAILTLPLLLIGVFVSFPITKTRALIPEVQPVTINQTSTGPNSPNVVGDNANVVINEKAKPRRLTGKERADLIAFAKSVVTSPLPDGTVINNSITIASRMDDPEAAQYARDFLDAFEESGWKATDNGIDRTVVTPSVVGMRFQIKQAKVLMPIKKLADYMTKAFPNVTLGTNETLHEYSPQLYVGRNTE